MAPRSPAVENDIVIEEHLGLVYSIAGPYARRSRVEVEDSEQFADGCLGLLSAKRCFDPSLGYQFSTYASRCIRVSILQGYHRRSETRKLGGRKYEPLSEETLVGEEGLEPAIEADEIKSLRSAIQKLDPKERAVIEMRLEGRKLREIADDFGLSKQRVQQIDGRSRIHLRQFLLAEKG